MRLKDQVAVVTGGGGGLGEWSLITPPLFHGVAFFTETGYYMNQAAVRRSQAARFCNQLRRKNEHIKIPFLTV
jgi:hypothetical protein